MKKISRTTKRWTALILAFIMLFQPVMTTFAEYGNVNQLTVDNSEESEETAGDTSGAISGGTAGEGDGSWETGDGASGEGEQPAPVPKAAATGTSGGGGGGGFDLSYLTIEGNIIGEFNAESQGELKLILDDGYSWIEDEIGPSDFFFDNIVTVDSVSVDTENAQQLNLEYTVTAAEGQYYCMPVIVTISEGVIEHEGEPVAEAVYTAENAYFNTGFGFRLTGISGKYLPVYIGTEQSDENLITEDGWIPYEYNGESFDPIELTVCRVTGGEWFYGVFLTDYNYDSVRAIPSGDDEGIITIGDWVDTVTLDPYDYPCGFELDLITDHIPFDGEFRVHMDEEYDSLPVVWYRWDNAGDTGEFRVRNDMSGTQTYNYEPGAGVSHVLTITPPEGKELYAAGVQLRQDSTTVNHQKEFFSGVDEELTESDGVYTLDLFSDSEFPSVITGGVYVQLYWSEDDYKFHHHDLWLDPDTQYRVEMHHLAGDRRYTKVGLRGYTETHHAFNRDVYSMERTDLDLSPMESSVQELTFEIQESAEERFDHLEVFDTYRQELDVSLGREDRVYDPVSECWTVSCTIERAEGNLNPVQVDCYFETIDECSGFTLDDVTIEGVAHASFEQELVLRLKEGCSWNETVLNGLTEGADLGEYVRINRRNVRDHDGVQDGDVTEILYAGIDNGNALHLTVRGTMISGWSESIELKTENLVLVNGEAFDGYVRNENNYDARWEMEALRKIWLSMDDVELPVRPDDDGIVSGHAILVLDEGYRFAENLNAGDVNKCFGINLEDDCQTVSIAEVTDSDQTGDRRKVSLFFEGLSRYPLDGPVELHFWDCVEKYNEQESTWELIDGEIRTKKDESICWDIPVQGAELTDGGNISGATGEDISFSYTIALPAESDLIFDIDSLNWLMENEELFGWHIGLQNIDWNDGHIAGFALNEETKKELTVYGTLNSGEDMDIPAVFTVRDVFEFGPEAYRAGESVGAEFATQENGAPRIVIGNPYRFKITSFEESDFELWQGSKADENRLEKDQEYSFDREAESLQIILRKQDGRYPVFRGYYLHENGGNTELITLGDERFTENEADREYTLRLDPGEYRNGFEAEVITYDLPCSGELIPSFDRRRGTVSWNGTKDETASSKNLNVENKVFFDAHKAQTLMVTPGEEEGFYGVEVMYPYLAGSGNDFVIYAEDARVSESEGIYTVTLFEDTGSGEPENGFWLHIYWSGEEYRYEHQKGRYYEEEKYKNFYYIDIQNNGGDGSFELKDADEIGAQLNSRYGNIRGLIPKKNADNEPVTSVEFRVDCGKWSDPSVWINGEEYTQEHIGTDGVLTYQIPTDGSGQYVNEIDVDYCFPEKNTRWLFRIEDGRVKGTALSDLEGQFLTLTIPEEDEEHVWIAGLQVGQDLSEVSEVETNGGRADFTLKFKGYVDGPPRKQIRVEICGRPEAGSGEELRLILKDLISEIRKEGEVTSEVPLTDQIRNFGNTNARWNIATFRAITIEGPEEGFTVGRDTDGKVRHTFELTLDEGYRWLEQKELQSRITNAHQICTNLMEALPEGAERSEAIQITSMSTDRRSITFSFEAETYYEQTAPIAFFCWDCVEQYNEQKSTWGLILGEVSNYVNEDIRFNVPVMENMALTGSSISAARGEEKEFVFTLTLDEDLGWDWDTAELASRKADTDLYSCFLLEGYSGNYVFDDYEVSGRTLTLNGKLRSWAEQDVPARIRAFNIFRNNGSKVYGELLSPANDIRIVTGTPHRFNIWGFDGEKYILWAGTEQTEENIIKPDGAVLEYTEAEGGFALQKFTLKLNRQDAVFQGIYLYPNDGDARYCVINSSTEGASVQAKGNGVFEITVDPNVYRSGAAMELITWVFPYTGELVPQFDDSKAENDTVIWNGTQNGQAVTVPLRNCVKVKYDAGTVQTVTVKGGDFFYGIEIRYPNGHQGSPGFISRDEFTYDQAAKTWTYELFNADRQPSAGYTLDVYWFEQEYSFEHITDDFDRDAYYLVQMNQEGDGSGYFALDVDQYAAWGSRYGQDRYKISRDKVTDGIPFKVSVGGFNRIECLWFNDYNALDDVQDDEVVYHPGEGEWNINASVRFSEVWYDAWPKVFDIEDVVLHGTAGSPFSQEITLTIREDNPELVWATDLEAGNDLAMKLGTNSDRNIFRYTFVKYNGEDHRSITVRVDGTAACEFDSELRLMVKDLIWMKAGEDPSEKAGEFFSSTERENSRIKFEGLENITIEAGEDGFTVNRDDNGYLEHDFTLTAADGYRFADGLTAERLQEKLDPNGNGWDYTISDVSVSGNTLSFHFKGTRNIELQKAIRFSLWDCVEKQNGEDWVQFWYESITVLNEKIRWNDPPRVNLVLEGETVTADCGQEKAFEYTLTISGIDWKWGLDLLESARSNLHYFFEMKDYPGQVWFDDFTYVSDKVIRIRGRVRSNTDLDVPVVLSVERLFTDENGNQNWGSLYTQEDDGIRIVIGDPHRFEIQGFDGRFSAWKGTELTDENRIGFESKVSYTEKEGGGFELQKFVLKSNSSDAVFRGVWVYPNNGNNEFYPIGSTEVRDLGEGLYEITLDPNKYPSGAKVRFFTNALPYDGQFIPSFDTGSDGSVLWAENDGEETALENGAYYSFTAGQKQTFTVVMPEGEQFFGIEVYYAAPKDGTYGFFVPYTDKRFTYDGETNAWSIDLFDGDMRPQSGYWLDVYWTGEEYLCNHLEDEKGWEQDRILVTVRNGAGDGTVTVEGQTGYQRFGERKYMIPKTDAENGITFAVTPGEGNVLEELWINGSEYSGAVSEGHLAYTWDGTSSYIDVDSKFREQRTDLGSHITVRDTRITAEAGEEYTAHLTLTLDEECGYIWAEEEPEGTHPAIRLNVPEGTDEAEIVEWQRNADDPKVLEVKLSGTVPCTYFGNRIRVDVIRGLLDAQQHAVEGVLHSNENSNALWNINARIEVTLYSGSSVNAETGVFTEPAQFVLELGEGRTWTDKVRMLIDNEGTFGANLMETRVSFVSVSEDRKRLTVSLTGKPADFGGDQIMPIVFYIGGGSVCEDGRVIDYQLQTAERDDICWNIKQRGGLKLADVVLTGEANREYEKTVVLTLEESTGLTFDPGRFPQDPADLRNNISFNGNPNWWEFTGYSFSNGNRTLTVTFALNVPYRMNKDLLRVFVSGLIAGADGMITEDNENAYWYIRRRGQFMGLTGATGSTGIRSGETKEFAIDRDGYDGDIQVNWSLLSEDGVFELEAGAESAAVTALDAAYAGNILQADILYDYDPVNKKYGGRLVLREDLYTRRSFVYENLEGELTVLEKDHTVHVTVQNPENLTISNVSWTVLPTDQGADTRITAAPTGEGAVRTEAVVCAVASTGSSNAQLAVAVTFTDLAGKETTETYIANINVYDGRENCFYIHYDANGGTGIVSSQTVRAGEAVTIRGISVTNNGAYAEHWEDQDGNIYWPDDVITPVSDLELKAYWYPDGWQREDGSSVYYRNGEKVCCEWIRLPGGDRWLDEEGKVSPNTRVEQDGFIYCTDAYGAKVENDWAVDARGLIIRPMYLNGWGVAYGAFEEEEACIGGKYYGFEDGWALADYVVKLQVDPDEPNENEDYTLYLLDGNPADEKLPQPENDKWRLEGWYTSPEGGTKVTDADLADIKDHCTLYGHWISKQTVEVEVVYLEQDASDPGEYNSCGTDTIYGAVGEVTDFEAPWRPGFTASVQQQKVAESGTVVTVKYDRNTYTLSFNMEGSGFAPVSEAEYRYGAPVELPDEGSYQKEGMTFLGWYMDGGKLNDEEGMPACDAELTPLWAYGENWIYDGIGWKYLAAVNWHDNGTSKFVGLPEDDPAAWYYLDEQGYMVQYNAALLEEEGTAVFEADGLRQYERFVPRIYNGQLSWYYAAENGWLIYGRKAEINGKTYAFDMGGVMAVGYVDEGLNRLSGEDCIYASYYFSEAPETLGQMEVNCWKEYTGDVLYQYWNYDSVWFRFGANGKKIYDATIKIDGVSYTFDENGVLSSGVTVVYNNGNGSEWKMENSLIPMLPGLGGRILPNQYTCHGYYFDGWKDSYGNAYTEAQLLSAEEVAALYNAGGTLELTAQWKPVKWAVELPELDHAETRLSEDSTLKTGTKVTFKFIPEAGYHLAEDTLKAFEITWIGEVKEDDDGKPVPVTLTKEAENTWSFTMPASKVRINAETQGDEGVQYKIEYWYQNTEGTYVRKDSQTQIKNDGIVGQPALLPQTKMVRGFDLPAQPARTPVAADGSTVYKYEYPREQTELALSKDSGIDSVTGAQEAVWFEKEVTVSAAAKTGYHFVRWTWKGTEKSTAASYTFSMPARKDLELEEGDPVVYTLNAESAINTYTVTFNKNSEEAAGTMADQKFVYGTAAGLRANAYTRPGYVFTGWVTEPGKTTADYTDGASVNNLTAVHQGVVTLYALWEPGTGTAYKVEHYKENVNGAGHKLADTDDLTGKTGSAVTPAVKDYSGFTAPKTQTVTVLADGSLTVKYYYTRNSYALTLAKGTGIEAVTGEGTYKFEANVPVTAAAKAGYTFSGWTKGQTVLSGNSSYTYQMTAEAAELTANATANNYKVKFNANGGTGTMADETFTYDAEPKALTANAFVRTGYTFAGWALTGTGEVKYKDGAEVQNLTSVKDGEFVLYARWTANSYSVRFNANGGSGTMADQSFTYDAAAKALTANAFTKTGYHFAGWAETAGGSVKYADQAEVSNLTAEKDGVVDMYAVWTANSYSVRFNANGGSGTMAAESFTYDAAAKALTANAFTKTGYHFAGWAETAGGTVKYADQAEVSNLTAEKDGVVDLYAVWTANSYSVRFNANGGSGTMADQSFTYDAAAKALTANAFTRTGYTFGGWMKTAAGTSADYADGQAVQNLTAVSGGTADLYALWNAAGNTPYKVKHYRQNVADSLYTLADTEDMTGVTDTIVQPAVKHYTGFTAPSVQTEKILADGSLTVNYYYTRNSYTLTLAKGVGIGSVTGGGSYKYEEKVDVNAVAATGYTVTGWSAGASAVSSAAAFTYTIPAASMTLTASARPNVYTVEFVAGGGTGSMDKQSMTYDSAKKLTANAFAKTGYHFAGWARTLSGSAVYADGASVRNLTASDGGNVKLYAVWAANTYTVRFSANGGSGTMEDQSFTYDAGEKALTANAFEKPGYHFAGWAETAGGTKKYSDREAVRNLTAENRTVVLYAVWAANTYIVKFNSNGGTGSMADLSMTYDTAGKLTANAFARTGYTFTGWADTAAGTVRFADGAEVMNLTQTDSAAVVLYAVWTANSYTVRFNANGGTGTMATESFVYDAPAKALNSVKFSRQGYTFTRWTSDAAGTGTAYANRQKVRNLAEASGAVYELYAQWAPNEDTAYRVVHRLQDLEDPTAYTTVKTEGRFGTTGAQTEAKAKNYEGFTAQSFAQKVIAADGSTSVEVKYDRNLITIHYMDGQTELMSEAVRYEAAAEKPADPVKTNYVFDAWYEDELFRGEPFSFSTEITEEISLYAKWNAGRKTVVLDAAGGSVAPEVTSVEYGGTFEGLPVPTRTGYGFSGWYTEAEGGELVNNLTPVTDIAGQTLHAHWESGKYTVSFDRGMGSIIRGSDTMSVTYDQPYGTLPLAECRGYVFTGWFTKESGGTQITDGTMVKITADQVLYARYEAVTYPVIYTLNGGTNDENNPDGYTIEDVVIFMLPERNGFAFAGWDITVDGKAAGKSVLIAAIARGTTGTVTLAANWTEIKVLENEMKQSSAVTEQAQQNENVQKIVDEMKLNQSGSKPAENMENALIGDKLKELSRTETGSEAGTFEIRLEMKLDSVQTGSSSDDAVLHFEITPYADIRSENGTVLASNVPVEDDMLNQTERISFRVPVPDSTTAEYAKVVHTMSDRTEVSKHRILTDENSHKYITVYVTSLSPFEISFTASAYDMTQPGSYTYTGKEIRPEVRVWDTETPDTYLEEGTDYTVSYENNIQKSDAAVVRVTILTSGLVLEKTFTIKAGSGGGGTGGGGSGGGGGSSSGPGNRTSLPSWVEKDGTWSQDAKGSWIYTRQSVVYKNRWGCIYNPYANTAAGQRAYDWFYFGADGHMLTGWFDDKDGNRYYLNPVSDGTKGRMVTGWKQIDGKWYCFSNQEGSGTMGALYRNTVTPDGYKVDKNGVWK